MNKAELNKRIRKHELWHEGDRQGEKLKLSNEEIKGVKFCDRNLSYASINNCDLSNSTFKNCNFKRTSIEESNFSRTNLNNSNFSKSSIINSNFNFINFINTNFKRNTMYAVTFKRASGLNSSFANSILEKCNFTSAILENASFFKAALTRVKFLKAKLEYVDFRGARMEKPDFTEATKNHFTTGLHSICPEEGSFIGFKKANGCLVKLKILSDARRSSAVGYKCRCDKARVLKVTNLKTGEEVEEVFSDYDHLFCYKTGEIVEEPNYNEDKWNECTEGIHFFVDKDLAKQW